MEYKTTTRVALASIWLCYHDKLRLKCKRGAKKRIFCWSWWPYRYKIDQSILFIRIKGNLIDFFSNSLKKIFYGPEKSRYLYFFMMKTYEVRLWHKKISIIRFSWYQSRRYLLFLKTLYAIAMYQHIFIHIFLIITILDQRCFNLRPNHQIIQKTNMIQWIKLTEIWMKIA